MAFGQCGRVKKLLPRIVKLVNEGMTVKEVADRLGVNHSSVSSVMAAARKRKEKNIEGR